MEGQRPDPQIAQTSSDKQQSQKRRQPFDLAQSLGRSRNGSGGRRIAGNGAVHDSQLIIPFTFCLSPCLYAEGMSVGPIARRALPGMSRGRQGDDLHFHVRIRRVNLPLSVYCVTDRRHHPAVSLDLFQAEAPLPAILKPFVQHLVARRSGIPTGRAAQARSADPH